MEYRSLLNIFPTPSFLKLPVYGLDISDRSIKYVLLSKEKNKIVLKEYGEKDIPKDLIVAGVIKEKDKLIQFLKNLKKELQSGYVTVILPEEHVFISDIKLPLMPKTEVRSAITFQLEEHVPLSPSEIIFDYDILQDKEHLDINLIAFSKKIVFDYRDTFVNAGFTPLAFEMEDHALVRAVTKEDDRDTKMIIDFGKTRTGFIIQQNGKIKFSSTGKLSGKDIDEALVEAFSISIFQAEKLKKIKEFVKTAEHKDFYEALLPLVDSLQKEILKIISFWESHSEEHNEKREKITKIIFSGGDSILPGLLDYLSNKLNIPMELANPWINILSLNEEIPKMSFRESLMYATALGLGIRAI